MLARPLQVCSSLRTPARPRASCRRYTTAVKKVFDRNAKMLQRSRMAILPDSAEYEYLKKEVNKRLLDRLEDIYSHTFESVLEVGSGAGGDTVSFLSERDDVKHVLQVDNSFKLITRDAVDDAIRVKPWRLVADEEELPLAEKSFDVVTSNLALHWVNDLPGTMSKCRALLKDDRLFIASMFGEGTLQELRNCLILAEQELHGGVSAHVSPYASISDMGNLLGKAGFSLTTTDQESIVVRYKDPFVLLRDIQRMGEGNCVAMRSLGAIRRDTLFAAASIYQQMYGDPEDGYSVPATFNVLYLCGWTPHESQPKPKRRGSASHSFAQLPNVLNSQPQQQEQPQQGQASGHDHEGGAPGGGQAKG